MHVDTIMHMLPLGMAPTIGILLRKLLSKYNRYTQFHKNVPLKTLRNFKLDWCRSWTFGSTTKPFGPWVSENCLAYCRVFKMAYSSLDMITITNENGARDLIDVGQFVASCFVAVLARVLQL